MRLDHVSYAATPQGLGATVARLGAQLGGTFVDGGVHPSYGTRNMVLPLADACYLEVVSVLDHPASDKAPFGQAVRARSALGGGWLGYVVAVEDIAPVEERLGRSAAPGHRNRPDGFDLRWRQLGVEGLLTEPQLPLLLQWDVDAEHHPSVGADGRIGIERLEIAGDADQVATWLGRPAEAVLDGVVVDWVSPGASRGLSAVQFSTPGGSVRI